MGYWLQSSSHLLHPAIPAYLKCACRCNTDHLACSQRSDATSSSGATAVQAMAHRHSHAQHLVATRYNTLFLTSPLLKRGLQRSPAGDCTHTCRARLHRSCCTSAAPFPADSRGKRSTSGNCISSNSSWLDRSSQTMTSRQAACPSTGKSTGHRLGVRAYSSASIEGGGEFFEKPTSFIEGASGWQRR